MRGRNFLGPGFWKWGSWYPYSGVGYPFFGWGRGNPFPFCRWFPWLPRGWWSGIWGPMTPFGFGYPNLFGYPQTQSK
ncbi:MAG: hypothetical protein DRP76_04400 [Candidatus Omnitrophota bacterium]|nr:MAG: hypothetical protein DRP76_04400 [Candidatus Omnitrophota bacterium]